MVENEYGVAEEKNGIGKVQWVRLWGAHRRFKKAYCVVGEKPDGTSGEGGACGIFKSGDFDPTIGRHEGLHFCEWIGGGFEGAAVAVFGDSDGVSATFQEESRTGSDEGVTACLVAFLSGLEEKTSASVVQLLKGGNGGFDICKNLGPDGDEVALGGEGAESLEGRRKGQHGLNRLGFLGVGVFWIKHGSFANGKRGSCTIDFLKKTRLVAGMAGAPDLFDFEEKRVLIAVDGEADDFLGVPARFSFEPVFLAGAAPVVH